MFLGFRNKPINCNDNLIKWIDHCKEDDIFNKFQIEDWNKIIYGISSNNEWIDFLNKHSNIIKCFSLYHIAENHLIGFAFILLENEKKKDLLNTRWRMCKK